MGHSVKPRSEQEPLPRAAGVTPRALILGLALVALNVYWVIISEFRWYVLLTLNPLFVTPLFNLFCLLGLNAVLRRFWPRWALSGRELVVIYMMLVMSCTIATHDYVINLMSVIGWPAWNASPDNGWATSMFPPLPEHLLVWDETQLAGYFGGSRSLYDPAALSVWLRPLGWWCLFIAAVCWTMLCLNVLFRRAWTDDTKLSFPIVRLPLAMTEEPRIGSAMRSRALWIGFALAGSIAVLNGLHVLFPTLPHLTMGARPLRFTNLPWSAVGYMPITLYPYSIGLAFLVPLDVSFSCWFFYLFAKAQAVVGNLFGYGQIPGFPFVSEQGIGGWLAFGCLLLWSSRNHLRRVIGAALSNDTEADRSEPMRYRTALVGAAAGAAVFAAFWCAAGMSLGWAVVSLVMYLLVSVCIARVRAEAGGQHTVWDLEPLRLARLFNSKLLGPPNLAASALSHWYWRLNRGHPMPNQLETLKLAQDHGMRLRSLVVPMLAALALSTVVAMWGCLHLGYSEGALAKCQGFANWTCSESYNWLDTSLKSGFRPEPGRWVAIASAAGFILLLGSLRARFVNFPLNPLGYCIGPGLVWHWFPFLIAWAIKGIVLRYGGLRVYQQVLPFFLGLVLGDYVIGGAWTLYGIAFHVKTYQFQFF